MAADSSSFSPFDPVVVDLLACPACLGGLGLDEGKLICAECGRIYPVVDGIPVLIAERAELTAISGARRV
jgi:uncharacterized protein YbaR (Trm112 family)